MADDIKNETAEISVKKREKKTKEKRRWVASFLILFFILAALVSVIAFNLFNLRDRYIYPFLAKLPVIGSFIPNTAGMPEDFSAMTPDEMIARINDLELQLSQAKDDIVTANDTIDNNRIEINRLKAFEAQQLEFKKEKADFDQRVAMGDPNAYADYYQHISPDNAETLYPQAAAEASRSIEIKKYLSDIKAMDETSAANVLQRLIGSDMNLVVSILQNTDSRIVGGILSEMDPQSAASIIKMMAPFQTNQFVYPAVATPASEIVNTLTELPALP